MNPNTNTSAHLFTDRSPAVTILTTVTIHMDKYCVYAHSIDGEIFYIGKGVGGRPFDGQLRNPNWMAIATGAGRVDVTILGWYEHEVDAVETERYLIKKLRPIANIRGINESRKDNGKSLVNRGSKRFPSVRNVARLTDYGNINDPDRFEVILRRCLGVPSNDNTWRMPADWACAYDDYFYKMDPVYAKLKDKAPVWLQHTVKARGGDGGRMRKTRRKTMIVKKSLAAEECKTFVNKIIDAK